jgi:hypothetical protein
MESPNAMILTVDCRLDISTEAAVATEQITASVVKPDMKCMVDIVGIRIPDQRM